MELDYLEDYKRVVNYNSIYEKKKVGEIQVTVKNDNKDQDQSGKSNDLKNSLKLENITRSTQKLNIKDHNLMNSVRMLTINKSVNSEEPKMILDASYRSLLGKKLSK